MVVIKVFLMLSNWNYSITVYYLTTDYNTKHHYCLDFRSTNALKCHTLPSFLKFTASVLEKHRNECFNAGTIGCLELLAAPWHALISLSSASMEAYGSVATLFLNGSAYISGWWKQHLPSFSHFFCNQASPLLLFKKKLTSGSENVHIVPLIFRVDSVLTLFLHHSRWAFAD